MRPSEATLMRSLPWRVSRRIGSSRWPSASLVTDIGRRTLAILAGILFIIRGVFEIALGWELHRIHRA